MDQLDTGDVTFETNTHGMHLGNPHLKLLPVELSRRGTPVFVHPSSAPNHQQVALDRPRPMLELIFDSARTVSDLVFSGHVAKYPDIPWFSPTAVACCRCSPIEWNCFTPAVGTKAQIASIDAAPQPDGDTRRTLTTRNACHLFPRLKEFANG